MTPVAPIVQLSTSDLELRAAARRLEAGFLAEMLKHAGFTAALDGMSEGGGGSFASFMVDAQAQAIVEAGGIGLAERIFHALKESQE